MKLFFKELGSWLFLVLITVVVAFIFVYFIFGVTIFEGSSMNPTITSGEALVFNKVSYKVSTPDRYDVISFKLGEDKEGKIISRVLGLPGETVQIIDQEVYINGNKLEDDRYGNTPILYAGTAAKPIVLGKNEYFVLGDNRGSATDSRYIDIGIVKEDNIKGKLWFRAFPIAKFGNVDKQK